MTHNGKIVYREEQLPEARANGIAVQVPTPVRPNWITVYVKEGEPSSGKLCKFDPERFLLELQDRGVKHYIDLAQLYNDWQLSLAQQKRQAIKTGGGYKP